MSTQRKNTLKNLIKKGMFTASAAAMLASTSALGTANRIVTVGGGSVSDGSAFGGGAYVPGSFISLGGVNNFTADVAAIPAIYLDTFNGAAMTVPNDLILGPVVPQDLTAGNVGLVVNVPNAVNITLTGTPVTDEQAAAALPAFAPNQVPAPGQAPGNTYYFNSKASTLIFDATSKFPATNDNRIAFIGGAGSIAASVQGQAALTLQLNTSFQFKHPSWIQAQAFNIEDNQLLKAMNIQLIENSIKFGGPNAIYEVSNESPNPAEFTASFDIVLANDSNGILIVHPSNARRTIAFNAGSSNTTRLNTFAIDGISVPANVNPATVTGIIFAKIIQIGSGYQPAGGEDPAYGVYWTTAIDTGVGRLVQFTQNSLVRFQDDVTSDIDFNDKAAQVTIGNGANVGGATGGNIDNTVAGGANILNFVGNSTVTGAVGAANPINILNVQGDNHTTVDLGGDVRVDQFNYTSTGVATVDGNLTATAGVNFGDFASTLTFNGVAGPYTFASPVIAAGAATLNVDTDLTVTDQSIGTIQTINIGQVGTPQNLTIAVNQPALSLLTGGNQINFSDSNSTLTFQSSQTQIVTFGGNLDGFASGGGNVILNGTNDLTIKGGSFGVNKAIGLVKTIGTVTANGGINFKSITTLNVTGNSNFTDQTVTSASATNINIGDGNGLGTYILTPNADFNLATLNMKFGDPDSVLNITSNGNVTATMNGDLNPGATDSGIIQLSSTGGNTLILDGVGTVGVGGNLLNSVTFSGAGNITVVPTINTANAILTGITGDLILNNVNAPINFTTTTNLTVSDVTGAINFGNNAGILNVDNGSTITGTIDGSGTINFGAGTEVTGAVGASNAITLVNFNAGGNVVLDSTSNATNFSIGNNIMA